MRRILRRNRTQPLAGKTVATSWSTLESSLTKTLRTLEDRQYLIIERKQGWGYVQFAAQGARGLRAECLSNNYRDAAHALKPAKLAELQKLGWLAPTGTLEEIRAKRQKGGSPNFYRDFESPVPFREVARMAVITLSGAFAVRRPVDLRYKAFERDGGDLVLPTLELKREKKAPAGKKAPAADSVGSLRARVLAAIRRSSGNPKIEPDENGDIQLRFGSVFVVVRVLADPLCVRLFSPMLGEVEGGDRLVQRLNETNANVRFARLFVIDGTVYAAAEVSASPLVDAHVTGACEGLGAFADETGVELKKEFGGRTAFQDEPEGVKGGGIGFKAN